MSWVPTSPVELCDSSTLVQPFSGPDEEQPPPQQQHHAQDQPQGQPSQRQQPAQQALRGSSFSSQPPQRSSAGPAMPEDARTVVVNIEERSASKRSASGRSGSLRKPLRSLGQQLTALARSQKEYLVRTRRNL